MTPLTCLVVIASSVLISKALGTPLDDYVNAYDPNYSYTLLSKSERPNVTIHVLNMTSQKWLTEKVTTRPLWWHNVSVAIPRNLTNKDTGLVWIDGGKDNYKWTAMKSDPINEISEVAVRTGSVCAVIEEIPNQPIVFLNDPKLKGRTEDDLIAWTWREFLLNGSNPEILLQLPMTKAVVRGMDTVSKYIKTIAHLNINKYVVSGGSKRGWIAWTTAAVDKRVIGMIPFVMDLLNMQKNLHHHFRSLGGWSFQYKPYYDMNITQYLDSPNFPKMQAVIDVLAYTARYLMPKLVYTASSDEFFLTDDSHYYYDQLQGPKYLRIVPNAEHTLIGHRADAVMDITEFFLSIVEEKLPTLKWTKYQNETHGRIVVSSSIPPNQVTVYHTQTLDNRRRDFRLFVADPKTGKPIIHPVSWHSESPVKLSDTVYDAILKKPNSGWAAFFIELKFPGGRGSTLTFTTEVNIVPDTFPFQDCSGESCHGTLV